MADKPFEIKLYKQLDKLFSLIKFPYVYLNSSYGENLNVRNHWLSSVSEFVIENRDKKWFGKNKRKSWISYFIGDGDETLSSLFTNIKNPKVIFQYCDGKNLDMEDSFFLTEVYLFCWDFDDNRKVFLRYYGYSCEYHNLEDCVIILCTVDEYKKILNDDEYLNDFGIKRIKNSF